MSAVKYVEKQLPEPGQKKRVAEGVYWLRFPLPFALDHINLWLLEDGDGWTLVDTGFGAGKTRELWQSMFDHALEGRPLRRIVVTHYHPDHIGQAVWLAQHFGAPVYMTDGEWQLTHDLFNQTDAEMDQGQRRLLLAHGVRQARAESLTQRGNLFRGAISGVPTPYQRLAAGDSLTINGRRWDIVVGNGHSPEHACLFRSEDRVLLSGDQILPSISSNISVRKDVPEADPLADFLASLRAFAQLPADTRVMPAHGRPFEGLHMRADKLIVHHEVQLTQVEDACRKAPKTATDLLPVLFRRELDDQQLFFAMGESIAHANHLLATGRVERELEGGVYRFRAFGAG
ncbi:MBL fold metallo-hydrolase [Hydrocarboniclastica marina]|uniref:MBL fold metallo-hydrolase n=1 Tax=Hydrocarboniclastica marina TaxID=2259620 RepID=A0A4P7XFJ5_9ALTE|nr:MBL fold metallo-hydrolase [Hydrocarboniclastica marina]QCF24892.1 MBL fold metallo-hydrolase [Hydrocarboniclastica marina]